MKKQYFIMLMIFICSISTFAFEIWGNIEGNTFGEFYIDDDEYSTNSSVSGKLEVSMGMVELFEFGVEAGVESIKLDSERYVEYNPVGLSLQFAMLGNGEERGSYFQLFSGKCLNISSETYADNEIEKIEPNGYMGFGFVFYGNRAKLGINSKYIFADVTKDGVKESVSIDYLTFVLGIKLF